MAVGFNLQAHIAGGEAAAGLAMCSSAAQPQTKAVRPQGRADLRAAERSAARRSRSGGPKKTAASPAKKNLLKLTESLTLGALYIAC